MGSPLFLDWCSYAAAKYACEKWHYSGKIPVFKKLCLGVWEFGQFVGVVMFGQGATPEFGKSLGVGKFEVCELTRVALTKHKSHVSRIVRVALAMLRSRCPQCRVVISFADSTQGHHGGIYQAGGWIYSGQAKTNWIILKGQTIHPKTLHSRYGIGGQSIPWLRENVDKDARRTYDAVKYRYLMPLDDAMRAQLEPLRQPYPKRAASVASDTAANHAAEGGAIPTAALSKTKKRKGVA